MIRRRRNRSLKTLLAALIVIGSICCVTVSGTYAVFTSQETNVAGTIASGTLTLQNSVNGGTACTSYGGSDAQNYNTGCTALGAPRTLTFAVPETATRPSAARISVASDSVRVASLFAVTRAIAVTRSPTSTGRRNTTSCPR